MYDCVDTHTHVYVRLMCFLCQNMLGLLAHELVTKIGIAIEDRHKQ